MTSLRSLYVPHGISENSCPFVAQKLREDTRKYVEQILCISVSSCVKPCPLRMALVKIRTNSWHKNYEKIRANTWSQFCVFREFCVKPCPLRMALVKIRAH